jgi:hypothetical protein
LGSTSACRCISSSFTNYNSEHCLSESATGTLVHRTAYQRHEEANRKFKLAVGRAIRAKDSAEKEMAYRWAYAWADVARSSLLTWRFGSILN